jgi:hypothetical protein
MNIYEISFVNFMVLNLIQRGLNSTLIIKIEHKHKIGVSNFSNSSQNAIPKTL